MNWNGSDLKEFIKNKLAWKGLDWIRKYGIGKDWKDCEISK